MRHIIGFITLLAALPVFAQPPVETANREHFFPLVIDGGGFQSYLFLTNGSEAANQCTLELQGREFDSTRFEANEAFTPAGAGATIDLSDTNANLTLTSSGEQAFAFGYAKLECAEPVVARILLASSDNGSVTSMATVERAKATANFQFPAQSRLGELVLVVSNDGNSEASCAVELKNSAGVNSGEGSFGASDGSTTVQFLNELIPIPDGFDDGTVTVSCDTAVTALGLPLSGPIFTVLSAISLESENTAKASHVLPYIVDGGGFQSRLLVTNLSDTVNRCTLNFRGSRLEIDRFEDTTGVVATNSGASLVLNGRGDQLSIPSTGEQSRAYGFATLDCDGPVDAQNLLTVHVQGSVAGMAAIPSSQAAGEFDFPLVPFAETLPLIFANNSAAHVSCAIYLEDVDGKRIGRQTIYSPPNSSSIAFLEALFDFPENIPGGVATVACDPVIDTVLLATSGAVVAAFPPAIPSPAALEPDRAPTFGIVFTPSLEDYLVNEPIDLLQLPEASGGDPPLNYSLEPVVPGLSFNAATRQLTGTPTETGFYQMSYRVEDADGDTDTHKFSIRVSELDTSPSFDDVNAPENQTYMLGAEIEILQLPEAAGGNQPVSYFLEPNVPGLIFDGESLRLSGTPSETGVYHMTYSVYDIHYDIDTLEFTISVVVPVTSESLLDVNECSDGTFVDAPAVNTGLVGDCQALVGFANALIETGLIPEDNVIRQWGGVGQVKLGSWDRIQVFRSRVDSIWLGGAELKGDLPPHLGEISALTNLGLGSNELSGRIPVELSALSDLEALWLYSNRLNGSIPPELSRLEALTRLSLGGNELTGTIPPELAQMDRLENLGLWGNELSGSIPPELAQMDRLEDLSLGINNLSGSIPAELGRLPRLRDLSLDLNELTGVIPPEIGDLDSLESLSLEFNELTGSIPPELGQLDRLVSLNLEFNQLSGSLPPELGQLSRLEWLSAHFNMLDGPIPPEFGELRDLEYLFLSFNQLTGTMPEGLAQLSYLEHLSVEYNRLHGTLPWEFRERVLQGELRLRTVGNLISGYAAPPERVRNPAYSSEAASNGNASHHSIAYYQGPLLLEWDWQGERTEHQTPILGRWAALAVSINHAVEEPPLVITRVLDSQDSILAESLAEFVPPVTEETEPGQWRTEYVFYLPGELFQAGNQIVHVIDPEQELAETDEADNVAEPIVLHGEQPPIFRTTFIPVQLAMEDGTEWSNELDPDLLMAGTLAFLPIADDYEARIGPPLQSDSASIFGAIEELLELWNMEADPDEFYHGIIKEAVGGVALLNEQVAVSSISIHDIIPHEFGHNFGLRHTPGCFADKVDENYPYPDGQLGPERGWERNWLQFISGANEDYAGLMSYCGDLTFMSGYNYRKAAEFWLSYGYGTRAATTTPAGVDTGEGFARNPNSGGGTVTSASRSADTGSIAVSGRIDANGNWSLTQSQMSERAPRAPAEDGEFALILFDSAGVQVYTEPLAIIPVSEGDESFWAARTPIPLRTALEIVIVDSRGAEVLRETLAL